MTNKINVVTKDSTIVNQTATATLTSLHDIPTGGAYLKINVGGGTFNNGTITVNGNVDGISVFENVVFTGARWKITSNKWDAGAVVVTTTGFIDETVVPTIVINTSDAAGNLVEWEDSKSFPARVRYVRAQGLAFLLQVKQGGIATPGMWEVFVNGSPDEIDEGTEFTISRMKGKYVVYGQVQEHMQLRTNMVDFIRFFAVKRSD
jgi:hypothetical protein